MPVTSKRPKYLHNLPTSITIGNAQIAFKQSANILGFTLDSHLTINAHVSTIARTCYFELRHLSSICRFLTSIATATLVCHFALSRIYYCNSLLFGSTHDATSHLQWIQNNAARVIMHLPKSSNIAIHLKSLCWFAVKVRCTYKIACLCYHCTAPSYISAYCPCHSIKTALLKVVNDLFLSLNKGNISVLALLDFSSAFDTIDHTILVHILHTDFGFTDTVLQWFSSYLTDRTQYVSLCNHCSDFAPVHSGVPQGSVLGLMLFTMYIKPLSAIIDSHSIIHHSFADDLQLQMSAPPDRISELLHSMQSCISDVKAWASVNMLKLNDSKTELMLVTSKRSKHLHILPTSITIGNAQIPFKQSVKNLGFTLDCHLTMNAHVSNIAHTCYYELRRLASIRRFLTSTATATLVSAFVLSRIDYCNSLLFGSTNDVTSHLQRIQNYAARVIFRLPMSSSITIHLKSLHWLPVKVRSTYKIACLCYYCHSSTAPSYVTDMLHKKPLHTRNTRSSSYTMPLLNRPAHSKATLGDRSFSFASSSVWNSIPNDVKRAPSLSSFKSRLKTYLFRSVYID